MYSVLFSALYAIPYYSVLCTSLYTCLQAGLADRIHITFCDYRELPGRYGHAFFDRVVSIEMIEAVGHELGC